MTKILYLTAALALLAACTSAPKTGSAPATPAPQGAAQPAPEPAAPPARTLPASAKAYVCEMGCEVVDQPGKCPKCGMELKEVNRADISYACPTCDFKGDKPGACPKDHMVLILKIAGQD
jgi:hypothetical protein